MRLVLPDISQMPLTPNADVSLFFGRHGKAWEIIIPVQLVPQPILFVVDLLFHCVTLPFIIIASLTLPPFCLLCFPGLCDQIVDLPAPEHLPKKGIVLVLLP